MKFGQMFPLRLLGFGFYWAWLFLVAVSPSPLLGHMVMGNIPLEVWELFLRLAFTAVLFAARERLSSDAGKALLAIISCLLGPLATMLLLTLKAPILLSVTIVVIALVDATTFILWMGFFGQMRFGGVALYMSLSYCIGGVLSLIIQLFSSQLGLVLTALFPLFSGATFYLSDKLNRSTTLTEDFAISYEDAAVSPNDRKIQPYLFRMGVALACFAFVFATLSSLSFFGYGASSFSGSAIESMDCVVLAIICGVIMFSSKQTDDLYALYKAVPLIMAAGLGVILVQAGNDLFWGIALVTLGYLMFEITALNDYCINARLTDRSLMGTFCAARIAITAGLLLGWCMAPLMQAMSTPDPMMFCLAIAFAVIVGTSTIVFTSKEIFAAHNAAVEQEKIDRRIDEGMNNEELFQIALEEFSSLYRLSQREKDILEQLLHGRNATYISERLYIAVGTVKTHTHNIYSKLDIHSKMELLDKFEEFRKKETSS